MARIRTIKPEFHRNEELSALPPETHLFAVALLNVADDEGYFKANPIILKADCCPLREDKTDIKTMLKQLEKIVYVRLGVSSCGKHFGHVVFFLAHQVVNKSTTSKIKELDIVWDDSLLTTVAVEHLSLLERKGKEQGKEQGKEAFSGSCLSAEEMGRVFEKRLWADCPKKEGHGYAKKCFLSACKRENVEIILTGYEKSKDHWVRLGTERQMIPNPSTWLNGDRWLDEYAVSDTVDWVVRLEGFAKNTKQWYGHWGPNPDSPDFETGQPPEVVEIWKGMKND